MNRFLAADYKPTETEVVVQYSVLPLQKDSFHECLHQIVEGLSFTKPHQEKHPRIFELNQESSTCKISYPEELFEPGNIAQNLSIIAGCIFENPFSATLKIVSIHWPESLQKFPGPGKGLKKIRETLGIYERPISSAVLLPKAPLFTKEYLEKAYLIWMGGCDIVSDNEIMSSHDSSEFSERIDFLSKESISCSGRTKSTKTYIPNITANSLEEMTRRARIAKEAGLNHVSLNLHHIGIVALNSIVSACSQLHLSILGTQSGQGLLTGNPQFGYSASALASLYRMLGIDMLQINTRSSETISEIKSLTEYRSQMAETMPVYSGNIHSGSIENIIKNYGYDLIIQGGKSIDEHPDGIKSGAEAFQYAIETATQGIEMETASKKNEPFRRALESWNKSKKEVTHF